MAEILVGKILKSFNNATSKPENFLSVDNDNCATFKSITKNLFDLGDPPTAGGLTELYTDGFDEEQIWQQLELRNEASFQALMKNVAKILSAKKVTFHKTVIQNDAGDDEEKDEAEEGDDNSIASDLSFVVPSDDENDSDFDDETGDLKFDEYDVLEEDDHKKPEKGKGPKYKTTEVDDKFFKLREMEEFLQKEEADKKEADDEEIDFFEDIPSDEDGAVNAKYKDFFKGSIQVNKRPKESDNVQEDDEASEYNLEEHDENGELDDEDDNEDRLDEPEEPREKRVKFDFDDESSEESSIDDIPKNSDTKSSYELRQERLKAKIKELEEEAVAPKPWQLLGETKAELRPENALLEEDLFFDHTTRQAPVITEETTRTLEDIIRQRIKDRAFDDVERKVKPVYDPSEYKKKLVLDQEKSKLSLAEIYEQEYLKNQETQNSATKSSSLADPIAEKPSDNKAHMKIRKMMNDVFAKLDALCNFHYTPRTPAPEIKIVSNMPSVVMEEIAPVTTSDANLLAPEEVQEHVRGEVKSTSEKEKTDRLRERRKKKAAQRLKHREKERLEKAVNKANPGMGNKHARERAIQQLQKAEKEGTVSLIKDGRQKAPKSSTAFFNQLQEDVTAGVNAARRSKEKSTDKWRVTVSQLKL
nr:EOG090X09DZ [Ilyocryptus agilis]